MSLSLAWHATVGRRKYYIEATRVNEKKNIYIYIMESFDYKYLGDCFLKNIYIYNSSIKSFFNKIYGASRL